MQIVPTKTTIEFHEAQIMSYPIFEPFEQILFSPAGYIFISSCRMWHFGGYMQKRLQQSSQRELSKVKSKF